MENPISNSIRNTTEFIAGGVKLVTGAVKGTKALQALQESTPEELLTLLEKLEKLTPQTLDKFSKSADPAEQLIAEGIQNEIKVLGNVFPQIGVLVDKYQKEEGVLGTIARLVVSRTKSLNPVIGDKVQETVSKQQAEAEALLRKAEQANKGADILGLTGGTKVTKGIKTQNTGVMRASTSSVLEGFREKIKQRNLGDATATLNGLIGDIKYNTPDGTFKDEGLKILEEAGIEGIFAPSDLSTEALSSLGERLANVLIRYEDSLKIKTPLNSFNTEIQLATEAISSIFAKQSKGLTNGVDGIFNGYLNGALTPETTEALAKLNTLLNSSDPALKKTKNFERLKELLNPDSPQFVSNNGGAVEIAIQINDLIKQPLRDKLEVLETDFQKALGIGNIDTIRDLNIEIQFLKKQLNQ